MATKKRMKRFDDGGMTSNSNYPFGQGQSQMQAPAQDSGGLGNASPLVQVNATPFGMKKGGAVKKMAVGGMGGMERKPVGPAMGRTPVGPGFKPTVLPTPPRGPKGPAMELKPVGNVGRAPIRTPGMVQNPGMPNRGIGGNLGGVETNYRGIPGLVNAAAPMPGGSFGGAKINPITEKVTRPAFGFGEKPTLGTGPVGTSPAPVGIGATGFKQAPVGNIASRLGAQLMGGMKKGGAVKKMASGGSASSRADGIASKGKTRGKMC